MSDNPFDVFAADFRAAVPEAEDKKDEPSDQPINIMAAPSPEAVPVMNQPVMSAPPVAQQPQMAMNGGGMGMGMNGGGMGGGMMGGGMAMGNGMGAPAMNTGMGAPPSMGGAPGMAPMSAPAMGMPQYGQPQYGQPPAPQMAGMGGGMAIVPSAQPANPYALNMNPAGAPAAPAPGMAGSVSPGSMGMAPGMEQQMQAGSGQQMAPPPFGAPPSMGGPPQPSEPAPVPPEVAPPMPPASSAPPASYGAPPAGPPEPAYGAPPVPQQNDVWGAPPAQPPVGASAVVPVHNTSADPFDVFNSGPGPVPIQDNNPGDVLSVATPTPNPAYTREEVLKAVDDPWSTFGEPAPSVAPTPTPNQGGGASGGLLGDEALAPSSDQKEGELPAGGEWYDARIFTPTLGVMFFKPQELTDSLFLQTDRSVVDALNDRPVVAFIVEGSSARAAGVELGHVLLKVNGIDVKNPKEASRLIKEGPRPLPLLFYVPDTTVVVAEGEHMVKYDTRETGAPNSAKDWKPKYCVIGGIIAQPWMLNMYRSKSEYDIAVIETQARRPVSVKVKQFSLQGARIQNDWQGPQMVKYKNKLHPWKYIVVLPVSRNPIKISSPNLSQLKPVHEGIRRVLMAQQRHTPSRNDPYTSGGDGRSGGANYAGAPQYGAPPPQQQQQQYGGPPPQQQNDYPPQQYGGQEGAYGGESQYSSAGGVGGARRRAAY
jgi:hypothetical protein